MVVTYFVRKGVRSNIFSVHQKVHVTLAYILVIMKFSFAKKQVTVWCKVLQLPLDEIYQCTLRLYVRLSVCPSQIHVF